MTPPGSDHAALARWCHHPDCLQAARQAVPCSDDALWQTAMDAVCRLGAPCRQLDGTTDAEATQLFVELVTERRHALYARQRFQTRQQRLQREREQREARRRRAASRAASPISKDEVLAAIARARAKREAND